MRRTALIVPLLAPLAVAASAHAAGETYVVVQCHEQNLSSQDARVAESRPYGVIRACTDPDRDNAIVINSRLNSPKNREGSVRWVAPDGTGFVAVRVDAKLRRGNRHYSRLFMADKAGRQTHRIATGHSSPSGFHSETWHGSREEQLVAALGCSHDDGCRQSDQAKTYIRSVRMTVADFADPTVAVSGSLVSGGWKRGEHELSFSGQDSGSGLAAVRAFVNGSPVGGEETQCAEVPGTGLATRLRPCATTIGPNLTGLDTAGSAFHAGVNSVSVCGWDFAGNRNCVDRVVHVDNSPPAVAFSGSQDPEDPELIEAPASDTHSGIVSAQILYRADGDDLWQPLPTTYAGGAVEARVDSTSVPQGAYEFRAIVTDAAGNTSETSQRVDGSEMRLNFPLKAGVELSAGLEPGGAKRLTIGYGRRSRVEGRLRNASGEPIAGAHVVVREFFGEGALIRERITRVTTNDRGRWKSRLPAGPSRRVTASYEGSQRYLSGSALAGRLAVRTKASLRTSKRRVVEGKRVVFRGELGRLGARVPSGGKLLELQVKEARNRYQTVGQGFRTRPNGRFRIGYRFGRFYEYDVRFQFRVKVARESNWPYKAPVRSRTRTVTVMAR